MQTEDQNSPVSEITPEFAPGIIGSAALERARLESRPGSGVRINPARSLLVAVVSVCLLLSVALYNGYPTIFSDTGSYLLTGKFFIAFVPFRAPGYSIFTRVTSLGGSAWFAILAQAFIVVYVLYETCDYFVDRDRSVRDYYLLASVCVLTAITSLPWLVSLLMPDVFAGVAFLSAYLLAISVDLHLLRRMFLAAILIISVSAHSSLFPIAALFVAAIVALTLTSRQPHMLPSKKYLLAWLLVPIIASGLWTANLNRGLGLGFRLAPSGNMFLLARLFADGLAADYLRDNCPKQPLISCRYLPDLPQTPEQFLFWHPLLRDLLGHKDEMDNITRGTIRTYPLRFLARSAKDTLLQFASVRTGDEIRTYGAAEWNNTGIQQVFPGEFGELSNDRQFRGRLLPLANALAPIQTTIFWLSMAACVFLARTGRFERINMFFYSSMLFLVINASICATFAGVYDRYQSRVAWIMPFCLTAYVACAAREWKPGNAPSFANLLAAGDADAIPPANS